MCECEKPPPVSQAAHMCTDNNIAKSIETRKLDTVSTAVIKFVSCTVEMCIKEETCGLRSLKPQYFYIGFVTANYTINAFSNFCDHGLIVGLFNTLMLLKSNFSEKKLTSLLICESLYFLLKRCKGVQ